MVRPTPKLLKPLTFLVKAIVDLIYPPLCVLCETRLDEDQEQICYACLDGFVLLEHPHTDFSVPGELFIDEAWALFDYEDKVKTLIHHLKYSQRRKPLLRALNYFEKDILGRFHARQYDWVLPVPLHPRKLRERGYNQVDDMAAWIAGKLGATVAHNLVVRSRYTQTQTQLNAEQRQKNLAGAFQIKEDRSLENMRILLVDDVLTTGATSNTLARVLKEKGCLHVGLLTISTPHLSDA